MPGFNRQPAAQAADTEALFYLGADVEWRPLGKTKRSGGKSRDGWTRTINGRVLSGERRQGPRPVSAQPVTTCSDVPGSCPGCICDRPRAADGMAGGKGFRLEGQAAPTARAARPSRSSAFPTNFVIAPLGLRQNKGLSVSRSCRQSISMVG